MLDLDALEATVRRPVPAHWEGPKTVLALILELRETRYDAALHRKAYAVALEDRARWKKMWHAKVAEHQDLFNRWSAVLVDLAQVQENRNDYESAFFDMRDERDALAELVTALRGDLYMAREQGR